MTASLIQSSAQYVMLATLADRKPSISVDELLGHPQNAIAVPAHLSGHRHTLRVLEDRGLVSLGGVYPQQTAAITQRGERELAAVPSATVAAEPLTAERALALLAEMPELDAPGRALDFTGVDGYDGFEGYERGHERGWEAGAVAQAAWVADVLARVSD